MPDLAATVALIRRALLAVLTLGVAGTLLELLLLKHFEDVWQIVPLALLGASLLVIVWHWLAPGRASLRALSATMWLFSVSGFVGLWLHYRGNVEWELERMPGISGFELFKMAVMGATPTLAPGTMLQLGLIGLLYAFRHPAGASSRENSV